MKQIIVTKKGQGIIPRALANGEVIKFTRVCISDKDYTGVELCNLESIENVKQEINVDCVHIINDTQIEIVCGVDNENLKDAYYIKTIGIYAENIDGDEILYGVSVSEDIPKYMPKYEGKTLTGILYRLTINIDNAESVITDINNATVANVLEVQLIEKRVSGVEKRVSNIESGVTTVGNAAKLNNLNSSQFVRNDVPTKLNVGRGDVYIENNTNDKVEGVGSGITIRAGINPNNGSEGEVDSIFTVRSAGGVARLWVGQSRTSTGDNELETRKVNITSGDSNTKFGFETLENNTGLYNTAVGFRSLQANTTGNWNTAVGFGGLWKNTTGRSNTALGFYTLNLNTTGSWNTGLGESALAFNESGESNTAVGYYSLRNNTTGKWNTSLGVQSLRNNTTGDNNTAIGVDSLLSNTEGYWNTAMGVYSLRKNTTGTDNVAIGNFSMIENTTATRNVAIGSRALQNKVTGEGNIAIGFNAGASIGNGNNNSLSENSIYIGREVKANTNNTANEIVIGSYATGYGSNTAHIGNSNVGSISFGAGTSTNFTNRSDERLKTDIELADLDICYDNIIKKLPIKRFKYIEEYAQESDKNKIGFIAQDFEKVLPKAVHKSKALLHNLDEDGNKLTKVIKNKRTKSSKDEKGLDYDEVVIEEVEVDDVYVTEEEMLSIDVSQLLPMTIGALQKLAEVVERQEETIKVMQKQIAEMSLTDKTEEVGE